MKFIELPFVKTSSGKKIHSYRTHYNFKTKPKKYLYLIAGVHGDEPEGIYVLKKLLIWLKRKPFSLPIIIIPVLNVDGAQKNKRVNFNGVDLNRNLPSLNWRPKARKKRYYPGSFPLSEIENQYLLKLFKKYPPVLAISFHSWKPLLNYNGTLAKNVAQFINQFNNYSVVANLGYKTPGSLGHFLPENFNASVLTYECPVLKGKKTLQSIWQENEIGLKSLFEYIHIQGLKFT